MGLSVFTSLLHLTHIACPQWKSLEGTCINNSCWGWGSTEQKWRFWNIWVPLIVRVKCRDFCSINAGHWIPCLFFLITVTNTEMRYLKGKWYIFCLLVLKVLSLWLAGPGATRGITAKKVWWSRDIHLRVVWRRERQKGPRRIYGSHGHTHYNPLSLSRAHLQVFLPLSNNPIQLLTCPQMDWLVQNLPDMVTYRWRITRGFFVMTQASDMSGLYYQSWDHWK
jgi:hypothetical protein